VPDAVKDDADYRETALALGLSDGYFTELRESLRQRRDLLCAGLADAGFGVYQPDGSYFVTVDIRPLGYVDGMAFCRELPHRCGVVAIPESVFYDERHADLGAPLVRFACCKRPEVLAEAVDRLAKLR
jgi:N-succinyldiaminopimelate aminotransferase